MYIVGLLVSCTSMLCTITGTADATELQQVFVPLLDMSQCADWYSGRYIISDGMVCAGYPEGRKDSCQVSLQSQRRLHMPLSITVIYLGHIYTCRPISVSLH